MIVHVAQIRGCVRRVEMIAEPIAQVEAEAMLRLLRAEIAKRTAVMAHAIGHRCGSGLELRVGSRLRVDLRALNSLLAATPLMIGSGSPCLSAECAT